MSGLIGPQGTEHTDSGILGMELQGNKPTYSGLACVDSELESGEREDLVSSSQALCKQHPCWKSNDWNTGGQVNLHDACIQVMIII